MAHNLSNLPIFSPPKFSRVQYYGTFVTCSLATYILLHRICEALLKADNHVIRVQKQKVKLSECINESNMLHYTQLTDHIFHQILLSTDKQLKKVSRQL